MFLCLDPGTKYLGYTIIKNFSIITKDTILLQKENFYKPLQEVLKQFDIQKVLIEKGEDNLRGYERELVVFFRRNKIPTLIFNAKAVRKKLKLERHPSIYSIDAKNNLLSKKFGKEISHLTIHEKDSVLLYLFHQQAK